MINITPVSPSHPVKTVSEGRSAAVLLLVLGLYWPTGLPAQNQSRNPRQSQRHQQPVRTSRPDAIAALI